MLISLLIAILVIGLLVWLVQMLPLPEPFRMVAVAIVVLIAIVWLLQGFGGGLHGPVGCNRLFC